MAVLAGSDLQSPYAGSFETWLAIAFGQREQSQAGAVTVLGMFVTGDQTCDHLSARRADTFAPVDQALWCPFPMCTVGSRHVHSDRSEATLLTVAKMARDALATVQDFYRRCRDTRLQSQPNQGMRHAVTMAFDFDVIVDVHLDGLEVRQFIALQRQRQQGWRINFSE